MDIGRFDSEEEDCWNDDENQPIISCPLCEVEWFNGFDSSDCPHLLFRWSSADGFEPCGDWDTESFKETYKKAYIEAHPDFEDDEFSINLYFDLDVINELKVDYIEVILYQDPDGLPMGGRSPIFLYGFKVD